MDQQVTERIRGVLETCEECLQYLSEKENPVVRQAFADGRQAVTQALEDEIGDSLEKRLCISELSDEDWLRISRLILEETLAPLCPANLYDREFADLIQYIWQTDRAEMLRNMLTNLNRFDSENYASFVNYFSRFPFWGTLHPKRGDYQTLERRCAVLKQHSYDFLWLYRRVGDYLSRRTLSAVLFNWAFLDTDYLSVIRSVFPDYWEPDIFPDNQDEVLVDLGAYTGDSILNYVKFYGDGYRKIYAYEMEEHNAEQLRAAVQENGLHDVHIRRKAVGRERGRMRIRACGTEMSAFYLDAGSADTEEAGEQRSVEIVPLDEDLSEPVTFIKMDIEGAERDALLGAEQLIRGCHPKLAVCVYHGYDDLWRLPILIDRMNPDYRFFLRHNGGNLIPTEFVLLCRP